MLRVQVSLPPSSHSAVFWFFFFWSQKTLGAFENFAVEVPIPAASFKLFISRGRVGYQLNTQVKQNMFKVYSLGAAVAFPPCPTENGSLTNFLCPSLKPGLVFFSQVSHQKLDWVQPSWICWARTNRLIVALGQNQFVYLVFKCDTLHISNLSRLFASSG